MAKEKKVPMFVEITESVKRRMARLAVARSRKLTAEVELALVRYLDKEEAREGLLGQPLPDDEDE